MVENNVIIINKISTAPKQFHLSARILVKVQWIGFFFIRLELVVYRAMKSPKKEV